MERLQKLLGASFYTKLKLIEDLFGDKDDAVRGRARLSVVLDLWLGSWRTKLLAGTESPLETKNVINSILETQALLDKNVHPRLAMEQVVLKF